MQLNDINLCPRYLRATVFEDKTSISQIILNMPRSSGMFLEINNAEFRCNEVNDILLSIIVLMLSQARRVFLIRNILFIN